MHSLPKLIISSLAVFFALMLCATDVMAQPGGGRGGRQGGRGGDRGGGTDTSRLLQNESVQKELDMSEEQIELAAGMNEGRGGRGGGFDRDALRAEMEGLSDEERMEKFREMRDNRTKERDAEINDILLPHQMERFSQIAAQLLAKNGATALTDGIIADKLNVTDEQKVNIRSKAEELRDEYNKKVAKLQQEMQDKLLLELTPQQREEYHAMMGEAFTIERQQRGGRGGQQGARGGGGRGGQQGGRGGQQGGRGRGGDRGGDRGDDADF